MDQARERQRIAPIEAAESINEEIEPVQSRAEETMILERLTMVMERELTEEQRNVIVLRFQDEFSLKETAEIIGKNVNASRRSRTMVSKSCARSWAVCVGIYDV